MGFSGPIPLFSQLRACFLPPAALVAAVILASGNAANLPVRWDVLVKRTLHQARVLGLRAAASSVGAFIISLHVLVGHFRDFKSFKVVHVA